MRRNSWLALFLTVFCFVLLPVFAEAAPAVLKLGDKGWKVKVAQQKLNIIGIKTETSGSFSQETEKAVREFQKKHKLKITGLLDDRTYQRIINEAFAREGIRGVKGSDIVRTASRLEGVPYRFGGITAKGFDCSGYVQYVFARHKAKLPRLADEQCLEGIFVLRKNLQAGDLVFFTTYEPGASHVGIYAGKGKFWHASSSRGVMLSSLSEDYWRTRYYGARRLLAD